tara:strand:- start:506 stop:979 length:474 start_codon:yes stop_codon:yes gene_type:complete
MNLNYQNIYNNLIKLTRNKSLYLNLKKNESFSDRIIFLLLHLSFFVKIYKKNTSKKELQEIYDYIFRQIEISIREIGYGDVSINKNMKKYLNFFYYILLKIDLWDSCNFDKKCENLKNILDNINNISFYVNYFDKLSSFYKNTALNYFTKDIEEHKF